MWPNPQFPVDLVAFTEEILDRKLYFLCSEFVVPIFPFWYLLHHPDLNKRKLRCEGACEKNIILWTKRPIEEEIFIISKGFIKELVIKQSPTFPSFSILIDCCMSFVSFLVKAFVKYEKLLRFHHQSF